ncbi:MAG: hypothetical protein E7165_03630 [Firmicutes bacterium]|nr:hypothetical protein [Bacillota bacterium]
MSTQKGGLKDRIRSWNIYLKYKFKMLKKTKEEKQMQKRSEKEKRKNIQIYPSGKYYSKPKILWLTLVGLLFGFFERKSDKENEINCIENNIKLLEKDIFVLSQEEQINITKTIGNDIIKLKSKNWFDNRIKTKVKSFERRMKVIEISKEINKDVIYSSKMNDDISQTKINEVNVDSNVKTGMYTPLLEIKMMNEEIDEYHKKLNEITEKIKNNTTYNGFYELEFAIKQLRIKFKCLLEKYDNLKELPGFSNLINLISIDEIDIYNLRVDEKSIVSHIDACNTYLEDIENKKKEILVSKKDKSMMDNQNSKSDKKQEKDTKKEKKRIEKEILDVELANKLILDRLLIESKNIQKFQQEINQMPIQSKKRSIFFFTRNILKSIVNFGLSLFPLSIFKNKFVGALTSGIMINNSLRSVEKILIPEAETHYMLYHDFEQELNSTRDYLNSIAFVCDDSLEKIGDIRHTVNLRYANDLEYNKFLGDYLKKLEVIESQILRQKANVVNLQQQVKRTKIKKKEYKYYGTK